MQPRRGVDQGQQLVPISAYIICVDDVMYVFTYMYMYTLHENLVHMHTV